LTNIGTFSTQTNMTDNVEMRDEPTIGEAPSSWVPALSIVFGAGEGTAHKVKGPIFAIGRSSGCGLSINNNSVSRKHAEIELKDGRYKLRDLGSKWGIKLNGQAVTESELRFGDEIEIAGTRMKFDLVHEDSISAVGRPKWKRLLLFGSIVVIIAATATLFYFKHQARTDLDRPGGDVLSQIIHHYDRGIFYYNQMSDNGGKNKDKVVEEMKLVIELDPDGKTHFSRSARRIIDGLEK